MARMIIGGVMFGYCQYCHFSMPRLYDLKNCHLVRFALFNSMEGMLEFVSLRASDPVYLKLCRSKGIQLCIRKNKVFFNGKKRLPPREE